MATTKTAQDFKIIVSNFKLIRSRFRHEPFQQSSVCNWERCTNRSFTGEFQILFYSQQENS